MVNSVVVDKDKQEAIDLFLGHLEIKTCNLVKILFFYSYIFIFYFYIFMFLFFLFFIFYFIIFILFFLFYFFIFLFYFFFLERDPKSGISFRVDQNVKRVGSIRRKSVLDIISRSRRNIRLQPHTKNAEKTQSKKHLQIVKARIFNSIHKFYRSRRRISISFQIINSCFFIFRSTQFFD